MQKKDVQEVIAELRKQYDRVREQAEFLKLKQLELHPDDEISFFGYLQAREQLVTEYSLLVGHARMVLDMIANKRIKIASETRQFLNSITVSSYAWRPAGFLT